MTSLVETSLTVGEFVAFPTLEGHEVLAGADALEREICGAYVLEGPDMVKFAKLGNIILADVKELEKSNTFLFDTVKLLSLAGVAAICLKMESSLIVPAAVIDLCDDVGLPLIRLPVSVVFNNIVYVINEALLEKKSKRFSAIQGMTNELLDTIQQRYPIATRLASIEEIVGNPVIVVRDSFDLLLSTATKAKLSTLNELELRRIIEDQEPKIETGAPQVGEQEQWEDFNSADSPTLSNFCENKQPVRVCVLSFALPGRGNSYVIILEALQQIGEIAFSALLRVGRLIVLEFANTTDVHRLQERHEDVFIKNWLRGQFRSDIDICLAARNFGYMLSPQKTYWVLLADVSFTASPDFTESLDIEALHQLGKDETDGKIFTSLGDKLTFILVTERPENVPLEVARDIRTKLGQIFGSDDLSLCLSEPSDIVSLSRSLEEVGDYFEIARLSGLKKPLIRREDLGILPVMYPLRYTAAARDFIERMLGELLDFDKQHGSQLILTLQAYLEQGYNIRETAEHLFMHYNTVAYRLDRIEEVLGFSVRDSETQFHLRLAFLLNQLSGQE